MRVVVTGAAGVLGRAVVAAVRADKSVDHVIALDRTDRGLDDLEVEWHQVDVTKDELEPWLRGADAVVHLAWTLASRARSSFESANRTGAARVFESAAASGAGTLLYGSSSAVYSPVPPGERAGESWPTGGIPTSTFSQQKVEVERILDRLEERRQFLRVVRLRTAFVLGPGMAAELAEMVEMVGHHATAATARLAGPVFASAIQDAKVPVVHADDAAEAFRLALLGPVTDAFNVASDTLLDATAVCRMMGVRTLPVPPRWSRRAWRAAWRLRLVPLEPGWIDLVRSSPPVDCDRIRAELGWQSRTPNLTDEAARGLAPLLPRPSSASVAG